MKSEEIFQSVSNPALFEFVIDVINRMTPDPVVGPELMKLLQTKQPETRGFVAWAAKYLQANNYLEIGVRRGWSLGMVAATRPNCDIYGFDLWEVNYPDGHGPSNPGPDFVADEIKKLGYQKEVHFISGNSHVTIPQFFVENPNIEFDLILVDGDHSDTGAMDDLKNTMPHVRKGGILLFDDIVLNPRAGGHLDKVFQDIQSVFTDFEYHTFTKNEPGVGIAIRKL